MFQSHLPGKGILKGFSSEERMGFILLVWEEDGEIKPQILDNTLAGGLSPPLKDLWESRSLLERALDLPAVSFFPPWGDLQPRRFRCTAKFT
jgi:hypothetical protein